MQRREYRRYCRRENDAECCSQTSSLGLVHVVAARAAAEVAPDSRLPLLKMEITGRHRVSVNPGTMLNLAQRWLLLVSLGGGPLAGRREGKPSILLSVPYRIDIDTSHPSKVFLRVPVVQTLGCGRSGSATVAACNEISHRRLAMGGGSLMMKKVGHTAAPRAFSCSNHHAAMPPCHMRSLPACLPASLRCWADPGHCMQPAQAHNGPRLPPPQPTTRSPGSGRPLRCAWLCMYVLGSSSKSLGR